jgi:hypothetical protein
MPGSPKWSLSLSFPHQNPNTPLPFSIRATCPAYLILLDFITRTILGEQYRSLSSSLYIFIPLPCYLIPLRTKYSPQHPILKHPQSAFLPQCERPNFTSIQNSRQNYTGLFISPSGTFELSCTTTKTDTAESNTSIGRESLQVFFCLFTRFHCVLASFTVRGQS